MSHVELLQGFVIVNMQDGSKYSDLFLKYFKFLSIVLVAAIYIHRSLFCFNITAAKFNQLVLLKDNMITDYRVFTVKKECCLNNLDMFMMTKKKLILILLFVISTECTLFGNAVKVIKIVEEGAKVVQVLSAIQKIEKSAHEYEENLLKIEKNMNNYKHMEDKEPAEDNQNDISFERCLADEKQKDIKPNQEIRFEIKFDEYLNGSIIFEDYFTINIKDSNEQFSYCNKYRYPIMMINKYVHDILVNDFKHDINNKAKENNIKIYFIGYLSEIEVIPDEKSETIFQLYYFSIILYDFYIYDDYIQEYVNQRENIYFVRANYLLKKYGYELIIFSIVLLVAILLCYFIYNKNKK